MIRALIIIEIVFLLIGGMVDILTVYQGKKIIIDIQRFIDKLVLIYILIYLLK